MVEPLSLRALLRSIRVDLDAQPFDWRRIVQADNKFHLSLARIAGNRVFESVVQTIYENISPYFERFLSHERTLMERNFQDLCGILEALEERDSDSARRLVQNHVRYFNRKMGEGNGRATAGSARIS